jgi:large subunit ribosomal protein L9
MKIVLREDVDNLGIKGDLVEVADGYARNYLVPRGLALPASKGVVKQAEAMRRNREVREQRLRETAAGLAKQLAGKAVEVKARAGEGGKLFGSVTSADIADAIGAQLGVDLDRKVVELAEPIKELGDLEVVVRLHAEVAPTVAVSVVAQ